MVTDGLNQAAAAFNQPYGGLRQPGEAQDMMRAAMQEVIRLANLEGVPLPPDNDVRFIDAMMPTFNPEGMPSMRQDVAIAEATGLPARCEPRLREQCFGKYEGTPRNGGEFRVSKTHFADRYDGGESMMQLAQRIYNLLDELKADTGKTYLLVAHNGIARVVQSYFYDMTNEEYAAAGIRNCELVEYHFE